MVHFEEARPAVPKPKERVKANAGKVNAKGSVKAQIRGIERLLKRDLPAGIRAKNEAKLAELQGAVKAREQAEVEKKFSKKYHMVKFFERKNLEKQLKKVKRELETCEDPKQKKELKKSQEQTERDLE
mmetsp:Transcript_18446/g.28766  ORF Transcript_18446/g.28766 Transcript_18446/m.28766 type:complete len:128 (-) Transcript_18446:857-1240(-)